MSDTIGLYNITINQAKDVFIKKIKDYGTSWKILRPISVVDQIFIKATRIRTIQENKNQMVSDSIYNEFLGIINYSVIGLINIQIGDGDNIMRHSLEIPERLFNIYDDKIKMSRDLMEKKNTDYGEAWRLMETESFVDLILQKIHRMKQIIRNDGQTIISEGLDANFMDILNYSVFALITTK